MVLLHLSPAPTISEDLLFKLDEYEKKVGKLSELLIEEEMNYRSLLAERDQRISELQQAVSTSSPLPRSISPLAMSPVSGIIRADDFRGKVRILEQRIIDMTISLEEKDKRIFDLEYELDKFKVELNQMRVEALRVPDLQTAIDELEAAVKAQPIPSEEASLIAELRVKIADYETTITELDSVIAGLKAEVAQISSDREDAVNEVARSAANTPPPDELETLKARVQELEEQLEISETNRQILKQNFSLENEEKLKLVEQLKGLFPTDKKEEGENPVIEQPQQVVIEEDSHQEVIEKDSQQEVIELTQQLIEKPQQENAPQEAPAHMDELKHVPEIDTEPTPSDSSPDLVPMASPPGAKCGGCLPKLFARRKPSAVAA